MSELENYVFKDSPDIPVIVLTEIFHKHCNYGIQPELYNLENYDIFLSSESEGRGVVIYVKQKFIATQIIFDSEVREHIWCKIKISDTSSLLVGGIYRSPNSQRENSLHLIDLLRQISNKRFSHVLIMGDFNFREINWENLESPENENHISSIFLEGVKDTFFFQHCKEPTRYRENQIPSILDLVFTNEENMIEKIDYLPSLGKSDHLVLMFNFNCCINNNFNPTEKLNFNKGDYSACREFLDEVDWNSCMDGLSLAESWTDFAEKLSMLYENSYQ